MDIHRKMLAWFLEVHWTRESAFYSLNKVTSPFGKEFRERGIDPREIAENWLWMHQMIDKNNVRANNLLRKYANNIIKWRDVSQKQISDLIWTSQDTIDAIVEWVNYFRRLLAMRV